jgi:PII-like signaling protein
MQGYQLTFFTQQDRKHHTLPLAHWLLEEARNIGISGATLIPAAEGFGHERKIRSAHFFDLADQPLEVTMAVSETDADRLFARLKEEGINVFYVKSAVEFGKTGDLSDTQDQGR